MLYRLLAKSESEASKSVAIIGPQSALSLQSS